MNPDDPRRSRAGIAAAATAIGAVATLLALTLTGVLELLPKRAATLIVVAELLVPFVVYRVLRRAQGQR
ncbi:MAG: hypothetical protein ABI318_18285 [Chthoniobacteraceae bacterium]